MTEPVVYVADTETTGVEPSNAVLLEAAVVGGGLGQSWFVEFEGEIPPDARAVHHISPDDVRPGSGAIPRELLGARIRELCSDSSVWAFHNAPFDLQFLPELDDQPVICTWRCAMHLWPDAPSYKNQVLRYWLGAEPRPELVEGLAPHRALYDAAVTSAVMEFMTKDATLDRLLKLSSEPILLKTVNFGKYKGESWETLVRDRGYVAWMIRSGNWAKDRDVMHTIETLRG